MNKILSVILFVCLVYQCLVSLGVYVWFESNRSQIAKERCINLNRPELACNGQCVLMKKLSALQKQANDQEKTSQPTKVEVFSCIVGSFPRTPAYTVGTVSLKHESYYYLGYDYVYTDTSFKPPRCF